MVKKCYGLVTFLALFSCVVFGGCARADDEAAIDLALKYFHDTMYEPPSPICAVELRRILPLIGRVSAAEAKVLDDSLKGDPCSWDAFSHIWPRNTVGPPDRHRSATFEVYKGEGEYAVMNGALLWDVPEITPEVSKKLMRHVSNVNAASIRPPGIVINVCPNLGGYVESTLEMVELFSPRPESAIMTYLYSGNRTKTLRTKTTGVFANIPVVIAMCKQSASAAEIIAGAIKHWYPQTRLVGGDSFGKGRAQMRNGFHSWEVDLNIQYIVTYAEYFIGEGTSRKVHGVGLASDIDIPSTGDPEDPADSNPRYHMLFGIEVLAAQLEQQNKPITVGQGR